MKRLIRKIIGNSKPGRNDTGFLTLNPFTLKFVRKQEHLEQRFIREYGSTTIGQQRWALLLGMLVISTYGIIDILLFPANVKELFFLRYAVTCPYIIIVILLSFFRVYRRYMQVLIASALFIVGAMVTGMVVITQSNQEFSYYPSMVFVIVFGYTITRLRFIWACAVCWLITAVYEIVAVWIMHMGFLVFITQNSLILASNVIGMAASYYIEFYARRAFYLLILLEDKQKEINAINIELKHMAVIDELTGIANRRKFEEYYKNEWQKMRRAKTRLSLIMCDIDFFKAYNDYYGHQLGDYCLRSIAKAIMKCIRRPSDLASRYGGEEFAIVLLNTDLDGAINVAEMILREVDHMQIPHAKSSVSRFVTISMGISTIIPTNSLSPDILLACADKALYEAKESGRNRYIYKEMDIRPDIKQ